MNLLVLLTGMSVAVTLCATGSDFFRQRTAGLHSGVVAVALLILVTSGYLGAILSVVILSVLTLQFKLHWPLIGRSIIVLLAFCLVVVAYFSIVPISIIWVFLTLLSLSAVMILIFGQRWLQAGIWLLVLIIGALILLKPALSESLLLMVLVVTVQLCITMMIIAKLANSGGSLSPQVPDYLKLNDSQLNSSQLGGQSIAAIEAKERSRIYRNIHDDVGSDLLRLVYSLEHSEQQQQAKQIMHRLRQAVAQTTQVETNMKQLAEDLISQAKIQLKAAGLKFDSEVNLAFNPKFNTTHPAVIMRMLNELITNICKHADADQVSLYIDSQKQALTLRLIDDGCGLQTGDSGSGGRGLRSLKQRGESIGADILWQSSDKGGTETRLYYPWT